MKKGLFILTAAAILMTACGKKEEAVVEKPKKPVVASQVKKLIDKLYQSRIKVVKNNINSYNIENSCI